MQSADLNNPDAFSCFGVFLSRLVLGQPASLFLHAYESESERCHHSCYAFPAELFDDVSCIASVVDPGRDLERIEQVIQRRGLIRSGEWSCDVSPSVWECRWKDSIEMTNFGIDQIPEQGARHNFHLVEVFEPNRWFEDGNVVSFRQIEVGVRHCPGHTPEHVVFYNKGNSNPVVGDMLLVGPIGRSDLPRGDQATLVQSIVDRLWPRGPQMQFISGYGPTGTFGEERRTNPFVGDTAVSTQDSWD